MTNLIIELIDRFGSLPKEVENLFKLIEIKILCFEENIQQIDYGKKGILFSFFNNIPNNLNKLLSLSLRFEKTKIRIRPDNKIFYDFKGYVDKDKFTLLKNIIKLFS